MENNENPLNGHNRGEDGRGVVLSCDNIYIFLSTLFMHGKTRNIKTGIDKCPWHCNLCCTYWFIHVFRKSGDIWRKPDSLHTNSDSHAFCLLSSPYRVLNIWKACHVVSQWKEERGLAFAFLHNGDFPCYNPDCIVFPGYSWCLKKKQKYVFL